MSPAIVNGLRVEEAERIYSLDQAFGVRRRWEVRDPSAKTWVGSLRYVMLDAEGLKCSCDAPPMCAHTVAVQNLIDGGRTAA